MDLNSREEIQKVLQGNEKLIWTGSPDRNFSFQRSDLIQIPFSILWCGFAIFWEISVIRAGAPLIFKLWGIPFIIVGLYLVFGRIFINARRRAGAAYGITSTRIIIMTGIFKRKTITIPLENIGDVSFTENPDRSGTLFFHHKKQPAIRNGGTISKRRFHLSGSSAAFESIPNIRSIHELVGKSIRTES